jgi:hypothetical protein
MRQSLWSSDLARLGGVLRVIDSSVEDVRFPGFEEHQQVAEGHSGRSVSFRVGPYGRIGLFFGPEEPSRVGCGLMAHGELRVEADPDFGEASVSISGRDPEVVHLTLAVVPDQVVSWWAYGNAQGTESLKVEMLWLKLPGP